MSPRVGWVVPLALALLSGCSEAEIVAELRSLQGSEDALFVCRDREGEGHPFSDCPDRDVTNDDDASKQLSVFALVSQTLTNEVAVVNVTGGRVVDVDPGSPGFGFLRVGGRPVAMAASPGGRASFVATADVGRNGIFALGTQCLEAPEPSKHARDLTSWPACRLDATPGELAVLVEPSPDGEQVTATCDGELEDPAAADAPDQSRSECGASLPGEAGPKGRRKLVVSLPDLGELAVIDAQWLLDQLPGTFPDCNIERRLVLDQNVPTDVVQSLPPDLVQEPDALEACGEFPTPTAPPPSRQAPRPAGFALTDGRLYVADETAPVIHVVDTSSVCNLFELPSLLPMSQREPERVVTTRRVAVSPLTPSGKQFVYAIDAEDQPGASVMAFDVSPPSDTNPGPQNRTPLVRPGSPELPSEAPDRLRLGSSAKDVTFAYRDLPYVDAETGVGTFGTFCDPSPSVPRASPAGLARPSNDFLTGARPGLLRGLFGFILLSNGTVAIVDVEDFDAPCRRPVQPNPDGTPDFRGCAADPDDIQAFTESGTAGDLKRTVTGEVSCRVVEPHRFRAATLAINDAEVGVKAPSLRGFPQLSLPPAAAATLPEDRPRLLGVPFVGLDGKAIAETDVFVGSTRYSTGLEGDKLLPVDPNGRDSEQEQSLNSVVLPPLEPRAYAAEDSVSLTYEGIYQGNLSGGFIRSDELGDRIEDASLSFCGAGVYDEAAMQDLAEKQLGLVEAADIEAFGIEHSDYIQITTELPAKDDAYWRGARVLGYQGCLSKFGPHDAETLSPLRDFRITQAFFDHLMLVPRSPEVTFSEAVECFPSANKYHLRAGKHWVLAHGSTGYNHDIVSSGVERRCIRSCSPLRKWAKTRVFEISSSQCRAADTEGDPLDLRVGCALDGEVACVYDQTETDPDPDRDNETLGVQVGGEASGCIFDGLTERFALYRGRQPSTRDSQFTWQTTGGFSPLVMSLANVSETVLPQSIQFLQQPELMAVVDGAGLGLSLLSLDTFGVTKPSPFY